MHIFISLMLNIEIVRDVGSRAIFWASLAIVAISFGMQDCESDVESPSKLFGACLFLIVARDEFLLPRQVCDFGIDRIDRSHGFF